MRAQYSSHALPTRLGQSGSNEASRQRPIWAYALRWKPLPSFLNERARQIVGIATLIHSTKIQSDSATFERRRRFEARRTTRDRDYRVRLFSRISAHKAQGEK